MTDTPTLLPMPEFGRTEPPVDSVGVDRGDVPPHRLPHNVYIRDGKVFDADTDLEVKVEKFGRYRVNPIPVGGENKVTIVYNHVEDRTSPCLTDSNPSGN